MLAHGLHKELVTLLVGKTYDLILNRRTIPGSRSADLPRIHSRSMDILLYDPMGILIGIHDMTGDLFFFYIMILIGFSREGQGFFLPILYLQNRKIYGFPLDPRRCAGLKPHEPDPHIQQGSREPL